MALLIKGDSPDQVDTGRNGSRCHEHLANMTHVATPSFASYYAELIKGQADDERIRLLYTAI